MPQRVDQGHHRGRRGEGWDDSKPDFPAPLTAEQARALRARLASVSPWQVVAAQAVAGLVMALVAWGVGGESAVAWSVLYGAACAVVPSAVLARGVGRLTGAGPAVGAVGMMFWEGMKIVVTVAMLAAAARVVPHLSWPALLVAMGVCMSVVWLALLWRGRVKNIESVR